jgi:sugar phosphate isomerase/epimerase
MKLRAAALSVILALVLLAAPAPSGSQRPTKVYRIGFLNISAAGYETDPHHCFLPGKGTPNWQAWVEGLREHGYIQGQNLVIECRYTEGHEERAPTFGEAAWRVPGAQ